MPRGAAVIRYVGKKHVSWRIKYTDASGRQIMETLGREPKWDRTRAERVLGARLDAVEKGLRKPRRTTFAQFGDRFFGEFLPGRMLKEGTVRSYVTIYTRHLLPAFGRKQLNQIDAEAVDNLVSQLAKGGLSAKTILNCVRLAHLMFRVAVRWHLMTHNPAAGTDRPLDHSPFTYHVLSREQIQQLDSAFDELRHSLPATDLHWHEMAKEVVFVALATGMRRGELLGLRWRDVDLEEAVIRVRQTYGGGMTFGSPKSARGRREIAIGSLTVARLRVWRLRSHYKGPDDLVFGHQLKGTPIDGTTFARKFIKPVLRAVSAPEGFRPFHDLRHTALTYEGVADNPALYVQRRAGHADMRMTEHYMHPNSSMFPGAADRTESVLFGESSPAMQEGVSDRSGDAADEPSESDGSAPTGRGA